MKPQADQGVVDPRLNVYGVTNLKVADMSVVPLNIGTVSIDCGIKKTCFLIVFPRTRIRRHFS